MGTIRLNLTFLLFSAFFCPALPLLAEASFINDAHKELHTTYDANLEADFAKREEQEQQLASKYGGAVSAVRDKMQKLGVAFAVDLADGEITRLKSRDYSGYPEGETIPDALLELREVFDEYYEKVDRSLGNKEAMTLYTYDMKLQELATSLRGSGDEGGAKAIDTYRANLLNPPAEEPDSTDTEQATPSTGGAVGAVGGTLRPSAGGTIRPPSTKPRSRPSISRASLERTMMTMPRPMSADEIKRLSGQLGEMPKVAADGTFPLLIQSMKAGQVTEITPGIISNWGAVRAEMSEGTPYWTVAVDYTTKTIFGEMPAEGKAMISEGKVVKWIYSGSLEPIP